MKMTIVYFFVFLLSWILVFGGLNRLITKGLSYDINKRYLHFRLIIAGILLSLITAIPGISYYLLLLVDKIINLPFITPVFNTILPNRSYELIYIVLCNLGLNLLYSIGFIIIFALTKIVFKRSYKFIEYEYCLGAEKVIHAPWYIVNKFYKEENGKLGLTKKGYFLGKCVKGIKWVFALLWIAEFALLYVSILWGTQSWNDAILSISKSVYLLPMVAFFLIEQIQLFLEGPEITEVGTFGTVDIREKMIGDMVSLMYRYRKIFSESGALLYSEKGKNTGINLQGLASNDLGNQQIRDCAEPGILSVITNQLRESGIHQSPNYQNAIVSLLNGDSINVRDNVDGEFVIYLCAYLNYFISQGFSAIIVCSDRKEVSQIKRTIKKSKKRLRCISQLWTVCEISDLSPVNHVGVLVCTGEELLAVDFKSQYEVIASDIRYAVILDSSSVMSLDSIRIEKIFSRLKALPNLNQYIFVSDEDNESLRVKIKQYLPERASFSAFSNDMRIPKTNIMIWKEESIYKPQIVLGIGNQASPYLGTAFPLALVATKLDLPKINIIPHINRADEYFFGGARQSNERDILNYLDKKVNLNSVIRYSSSEATTAMDLKMLVIYDTDYNFFNALWKWFKYGGSEGTLIHVISPYYMMREFFAANAKSKYLLYSNNEFKALLPNETILKRTLLASILASLIDVGMTEDEIMGMSNKFGWGYTDVALLLQDAILTVRPEREFHNVYEHFKLKEDPPYFEGSLDGFSHHIRVKLSDSNLIAQQKAQLSLARMSYKTNEYIELPLLSGNIWNYYLPNQIIEYRGFCYKVATIDSENGIVHTKMANPLGIPDYYTICDYQLSKYTIIDNCVDSAIFDCNICEATASKIIHGYVSSENGNNFSSERKPIINRINNFNAESQKITLDNIPVLEINFLCDSFGSTTSRGDVGRKSVLLLCVILNGLFKTLYPKTYQNIVAVPDFPIDSKLIDRVLYYSAEYSVEDVIKAITPRIDVTDTRKDNRFVRMYILEFSCIEYGMVRSVYDNIEQILNMAYEYLIWYLASNKEDELENSQDYIRGRYLHFGLTSIPDIFAPVELCSLLREILGRADSETIIEPDRLESPPATYDTVAECSFCGREIIFGWQLSDGRFMCTHCHDHQKTQKDEIYRLFLETKAMIESYYHISFRKDINVRFQSADAIRKAAGSVGRGRIVGFYNYHKRQLWIEARGPSVAMESTIIHELTHAWQYDELPLKELSATFPKPVREKRIKLLLEGHATYIEIESMLEKGEAEYSKRLKNNYLRGNDVYSLGYKLVSDCFKNMEIEGNSMTSFIKMQNLVERIINKEEAISWPEGY